MKKGSSLILIASITIIIASVTVNTFLGYCADPSLYLCTCDVDGKEKYVFKTDENVYVKGAYFSVNREVTIYVIPNRQSITPENAATDPVNQTITDYILPITMVWAAPIKVGEYDVWVDINQNGIFEHSIDRYHFWCCYYEFHVIPEYLIGALGSLTAMVASFILFHKTRDPTKTE